MQKISNDISFESIAEDIINTEKFNELKQELAQIKQLVIK